MDREVRSRPMTSPGAPGGADPVDRELRDLTDHQRATSAAETRRREHWLRLQAADEGSFGGVLVDLAEQDRLLAVSTLTGRTLRGVIGTIGADFVGLRSPTGESVLVPLHAFTAIRTEPGSASTVGDRAERVGASLAAVLHDLSGERPWVLVHTADGEAVAGELRGVGRDLVLLRSTNGDTTYVPLAAVADVVLA